MKFSKVLKRIVTPSDWLLEKDIHDLEIEIELMKRQLPTMEQRLRELKLRKQDYQS